MNERKMNNRKNDRNETNKKFKQRVLSRLYGEPDEYHDDEPQTTSTLSMNFKTGQLKDNDYNTAPEEECSSFEIIEEFESLHTPVKTSSYTEGIAKWTEKDLSKSSQEDECSDKLLTENVRHCDIEKSSGDLEQFQFKKQKLESEKSSIEGSTSNKQTSGDVCGKTLSNNGDLTKNQKRKLKKKRRAKERAGDTKPSNSTEFVFENRTAVEQRLKELDSVLDQRRKVLEFMEGLRDLYKVESEDSMSPQKIKDVPDDFLKIVEDALVETKEGSEEELSRLHSVTTVLLLQDREKSLDKVDCFQAESSLETDIKNYIVHLFRFWTDRIMNR